MGLSPGFLFFAALSASLHCGKTLGPEKSFEYGKVFEEYCWETRTFEEGKKKAPLIQGGGPRQAHTFEKVENPSSILLSQKGDTKPGLKIQSSGSFWILLGSHAITSPAHMGSTLHQDMGPAVLIRRRRLVKQ